MGHWYLMRCTWDALITTPALGYLDFNEEFVLETGLGAVLSQDESSKLHVIAYTSRTLHPSERSMCN